MVVLVAPDNESRVLLIPSSALIVGATPSHC